ncbi:MAG: hypothetical protein R2838_24235 [Caldilineaceae bacterium]
MILGYMTGRSIPDHALRIGAQANLRSGTVIYGGTHIGVGLETGHNVVIREENVIGDHVGIWGNTVIDYGCTIGNNVKIHTNCYIAQFTVIEDDVFIAPASRLPMIPIHCAPNVLRTGDQPSSAVRGSGSMSPFSPASPSVRMRSSAPAAW